MNPIVFAGTALVVVIAYSAPARAQSATPAADRVSVRPFAAVAFQRFAADTTFDAIFGSPGGTLIGGGLLVTHRRLFVEASASRFRRSGERAFATDEDGFGLDIPLTVTITPVEFVVGYRFEPIRTGITPYVGGGVGLYHYTETSPSAELGEEVNAKHAGWLLVCGAEVRVRGWIALGADLSYTNVPGIIGQGGLSREVDEANLGGVAARFKIIFGRR